MRRLLPGLLLTGCAYHVTSSVWQDRLVELQQDIALFASGAEHREEIIARYSAHLAELRGWDIPPETSCWRLALMPHLDQAEQTMAKHVKAQREKNDIRKEVETFTLLEVLRALNSGIVRLRDGVEFTCKQCSKSVRGKPGNPAPT